MFYSISNSKIRKIEETEISKSEYTVSYINAEELPKFEKSLGLGKTFQNVYQKAIHRQSSGLDIYDDFSFGVIKIPKIICKDGKADQIVIMLKNNGATFIVVDDKNQSTRKLFKTAIDRYKENVTPEKVVYSILETLLLEGSNFTEGIWKQINQMEANIVAGKLEQNMNSRIFKMRNQMYSLQIYYDSLVDFGEALEVDSNDVFGGENFRYFTIYTEEARRFSDNVKIICGNLIHIREAYEAEVSNNMNRTMQLFTVLSAIFLPLTLLVGWYGMNFTNMPELAWKYGYLGVVIASIIIVAICFAIFKKKKFF